MLWLIECYDQQSVMTNMGLGKLDIKILEIMPRIQKYKMISLYIYYRRANEQQ